MIQVAVFKETANERNPDRAGPDAAQTGMVDENMKKIDVLAEYFNGREEMLVVDLDPVLINTIRN